jgi:hypothetical protein
VLASSVAAAVGGIRILYPVLVIVLAGWLLKSGYGDRSLSPLPLPCPFFPSDDEELPFALIPDPDLTQNLHD